MKRIFSLFLIFCVCWTLAIPALAVELVDPDKEYEQEEPVENGFQGELDPDKIVVSDEKGYVNVFVNVNKNRPTDFKEYDFRVTFDCDDNGLEYYLDVKAEDNYKAKIELPYGNYSISYAGVAQDVRGLFDLDVVGENVIKVGKKESSVELRFHNINVNDNEQKETINIEPIKKETDYKQIYLIISIVIALCSVVGIFCGIILFQTRKYKSKEN